MEMVPILKPEYVRAAFYDPTTIGLEVSSIHQGYIKHIKANGGDIVCKAEVQTIERVEGMWHVHTAAGDFCAPVICNAAGAWADEIARKSGYPQNQYRPQEAHRHRPCGPRWYGRP